MLVDYKVNTRLKLAILWACIMSLYIYADFFLLMTPDTLKNMMEQKNEMGPITPAILIGFSIILIIPALMMPASVLLKPKLSKWLNIIFGAFYCLFSIDIMISEASNEWTWFYVLFQIAELVILIYIIRTAWYWPKKN
jgi:threonine/homoserine/homoserine lactone efflux protein